MGSNVPYLGCKIYLISKSEIRYEGILYSVDIKGATVSLAQVRSFGTEDRPTDRPVLPRDEVYEYIIFRGSDIKDLQICESPKSQYSLPHDPAIVQHSPPISQYQSLSYNQPFSALCGLSQVQHFPSQPSYAQFPGLFSNQYSNPGSRRASTSQKKISTTDAGVQVSVGGSDYGQRERREPLKPRNREVPQSYQNRRMPMIRPQNVRGSIRRGRGRQIMEPRNVEKFDFEYDFEQANAEFQELENKLSKNSIDDNSNRDDLPSIYDKSKSFFDKISCEATERGMRRFDWRSERKLNVETFGMSANNAWLRRQRGRGFRRGYRGRGAQSRGASDVPAQKTVTFDETPSIQEIEVVTLEEKSETLPTVEVVVDKEASDWPDTKAQSSWK